jgi:hypothetical protein
MENIVRMTEGRILTYFVMDHRECEQVREMKE